MMKLRNSVIAKITAWMFCIASIMGTVVLGICLAYGICDGLLEQTREEALKSIYRYANMTYSREAFWNRGNSIYAESLREEYFKYGIIKSDSLAEVDFHDRLSYLDTNMTDEELANIISDQLFIYLLVEKGNGSLAGIPMEYYGDYGDMASLAVESDALIKDSEWTYLYADRICYDVAKGIVYYRAEGNYYPVQNVSLCYDGSEGKKVYNYNYDFNNRGYMLNYQSMDTSLFDNYTEEFLDDLKQLQEVTYLL